jgi:hypothetical protein
VDIGLRTLFTYIYTTKGISVVPQQLFGFGTKVTSALFGFGRSTSRPLERCHALQGLRDQKRHSTCSMTLRRTATKRGKGMPVAFVRQSCTA